MITARRVEATDSALIDPAGGEWRSAPATEVSLDPTPLISQPSVYVQAKWEPTDYGATGALSVQALHNDNGIFFRLQWDDTTNDDDIGDTDQFTDAAAVLFPVNEDAPLSSMGSAEQPVNAWYWRPDLETPFSVTSIGTGQTRRTVDPSLRGNGAHQNNVWAVVIGRRPDAPHSRPKPARQRRPPEQRLGGRHRARAAVRRRRIRTAGRWRHVKGGLRRVAGQQ